MRGWISELKRRNVFRVAVLYVSVSWFVAQGLSLVFNTFEAPSWMAKVVIAVLVLGFVPALVFSWLFEITPEGIRREVDVAPEASIAPGTGRHLDRMILAALVLLVTVLLASQLWRPGSQTSPQASIDAVASVGPGALEAPGPEPHSIAVLPLANTTGDPGLVYFSDGLSEELISTLAQSTRLKVIGRMSSFRFRDSTESTASIGSTLGAAYLLGGSVRGTEELLRVNVALVEAATGANVWSSSYDRSSRDLLAVQQEIAGAVANHLQARLRGDAAAPGPMSEARLAAYREAMQGRHFHNLGTDEGLELAVTHFGKAIELDPGYAFAHGLLANSLNVIAQHTRDVEKRRELGERALREVEAAMHLDPDLAYAHSVRGLILTNQPLPLDILEIEASIQRAVQLAPHEPAARSAQMFWLVQSWRSEEALPIIRRNLETDPLHVASWTALESAHSYLGNAADAEQALHQGVALRPAQPRRSTSFTYLWVEQGRFDEARRELEHIEDEAWKSWAAALLYQRTGETEKSDSALKQLIDGNLLGATYIAELYADRQDTEQAFAWLERAARDGDPTLNAMPQSSFFRDLRDDPRMAEFTRRHGLPLPPAAAGASAGI